ncbi:Mss4-like protein [Glarea lozoyensis ATCC 20868]|uniref:Mss4-like protein n=1 Tax=Glarea lozoyensis (strain ATCC 20868 / MF5171) TaxID=1116229 RepID=S3CJN5_GLAL2|nr:Mss4-like protein [Glarea lozoyensis ATCC 20868]EPE26015.1 Mss4-like protein [Glarea lozoyensis ATCC 20868]
MPQSSCLCTHTAISYAPTPLLKFRCHCLDERKLTGAAFALNILYPDTSLTVLRGELKTWAKRVDSGNEMVNHMCATCGSLLYRSSSGYPGTIVIKAGCVDGVDAAEEFVPDVELFTRSRVSWVKPVEGAKQEVADFTS